MAVTWRATEIVWLDIGNDDGKFPILPTDPTDVCGRVRKFMEENGIAWAHVGGGSLGGNQIHMPLYPRAAALVIDFLKASDIPRAKRG